jgi:hypothetical protein
MKGVGFVEENGACGYCGDELCPGSCRPDPGTYLVLGGLAVLIVLGLLAYLSYKI